MSPMRASTEEFMDETAMRVGRGMCARLGRQASIRALPLE